MSRGAAFRVVTLAFLVAGLLSMGLFGCSSGPSGIERKADALIRHGMAQDAARLVRQEILRSPGNPKLEALLGRTQLAMQDYAGADSSFHSACMLDTSFVAVMASAYFDAGRAHLADGDLERARWTLGRATEADPSCASRVADTCVTAGTRFIESDPGRAGEIFSLASRIRPATAEKIGRAWLVAGSRALSSDPARGQSDLDQAVSWAPTLSREAGQAIASAMQRADQATREGLAPLADRYGQNGRSGFVQASGGTRAHRAVNVPASGGWAPSGFVLAAGDTITLAPSGSVRAEANRDGWVSEACGPAGWPAQSMEWMTESRNTLPLSGAPRMALIARVGGDRPFAIPRSMSYVAVGAGPLELAVNEFPTKARSASGRFTVAIDAPMRALHP